MKPNFLIFVALLTIAIAAGCTKETDVKPANQDKPLAYCAGGYVSLEGAKACYWYDTIQVDLPCPGSEPFVTAMTVENGVDLLDSIASWPFNACRLRLKRTRNSSISS